MKHFDFFGFAFLA